MVDSKSAKTSRARRFLRNREAKLNENPKTALLVRGQKTSGLINSILIDLFMLKKPYGVHLRRHNAVHPFEDATPMEFLSQKNDASLFAFGTHSKKRPHNLVFGRLFDHHILDMVETGVAAFKQMSEFPGSRGGCSLEAKPCVVFSGAAWEQDASLTLLRSLWLDFFQLREVESISSIGVEHALVFTATGDSASGVRAMLRHYMVKLKKSAEATGPYVELSEIGPSLDLTVRRVHHASESLTKQAMTRPKASAAAPKKVKNIEHGRLSGRQGRLHVPKQNLNEMTLARPKALRKRKEGTRPDSAVETKKKRPRTSATSED